MVRKMENLVFDYAGLSSSSGENGPPENWLKGLELVLVVLVQCIWDESIYRELMAVKQIPLVNENGNNSDTENIQNSMQEQQREMMLLKELNHENIVRYFGSTTDENF